MTDETLFAEAMALTDGSERSEYLDKHSSDSQQRQRVLDLLQASEGTNLLDKPVRELESTKVERLISENMAEAGEQIGPYKLFERIGDGGMGEVWVAVQNEPVKRRVAVKLIKAGMDSRAVLARFEAERQALALMDHPNIAKVLDAGTTNAGRPYFVMELVKGVPITRYCDENHLTPRQRLELFVPVCHAIQHAHQKGIIHRDIKPSNVLVALYDDHPVPKVIDFGVAKAAGQTLTDKTLMTGFGSVVGTPEYMSPEQASLNNLDVDTRSDIYSLGVLLYELLTGSTPVDRKSLGKAALLEILRVVREVEAPRPSVKLSTIDTLPSIAANRSTEPKKLSALMKGELDWVLLKALEKDRTRRYDTANGLARDIQRYLTDELVEARPPSASYRLRKFVRRNKGQVVAASLLMLVLLAGITGTTYGLFKAQRQTQKAVQMRQEADQAREIAIEQQRMAQQEEKRAEREALAAKAVRDFLSNDLLLNSSTVHQAEARRMGGGNFKVKTNPTVLELLDRAAEKLTPEKLEAKFPGMPVVQAEVLATIGMSYYAIESKSANFKNSRGFLERAIELFRANDALRTLPALNARDRMALMVSYTDLDKGIILMEEVFEDMKRIVGPFHRDTFAVRFSLAEMYTQANHPNIEKGFHQSMVEDAQREFGSNDFLTGYARFEWAYLLMTQGKRNEAFREMESLYKHSKTTDMPMDHPYFMLGLVLLADAYRDEGRTNESTEVQKTVLAYWDANGMATDPETRQTRHLLGWNYMRSGHYEKALETFRNNVPASLPPYDVMTSEAIYSALMELGRYEEALAQIQNSLELLTQQIGTEKRTYEWGRIQSRIGLTLVELRRYEEAEKPLLDGFHQMVKSRRYQPSYDAAQIPTTRLAIYELYLALNRDEDAQRWADEQMIPGLQQEASERSFLTGQDTSESLKASTRLATFYERTNRIADALSLIESIMERGKANGWPLNTQSLFSMLDKRNGWPLAADILRDVETLERIACDAGRTDLAVTLATDVHSQMSKIPNAPTYLLATCKYSLGCCLLMDQNFEQAEPLLLEYFEYTNRTNREVESGGESRLPETLDRLVELYTAMGKPDEVEKYRRVRADFPSEVNTSLKELK